MGISISEFDALGEKPENQKEFDLKYEEYQKNLPLESKIILDSRLGFLCQPAAFKVFLDVEDSIASERIRHDERATDSFASAEEALLVTQKRNRDTQLRYLKLYNIDWLDPMHYDLVIDTSSKTPQEVVDLLLEHFERFASSL